VKERYRHINAMYQTKATIEVAQSTSLDLGEMKSTIKFTMANRLNKEA